MLQEAVVSLLGEAVADESWRAGFDGMVAYAREAGWVSADGTTIRAHCTTRGSSHSPR